MLGFCITDDMKLKYTDTINIEKLCKFFFKILFRINRIRSIFLLYKLDFFHDTVSGKKKKKGHINEETLNCVSYLFQLFFTNTRTFAYFF